MFLPKARPLSSRKLSAVKLTIQRSTTILEPHCRYHLVFKSLVWNLSFNQVDIISYWMGHLYHFTKCQVRLLESICHYIPLDFIPFYSQYTPIHYIPYQIHFTSHIQYIPCKSQTTSHNQYHIHIKHHMIYISYRSPIEPHEMLSLHFSMVKPWYPGSPSHHRTPARLAGRVAETLRRSCPPPAWG